jgi:enterochelin esterase-like enzyme
MKKFLAPVLYSILFTACGQKIKEKNDEVYSRHLQRKVHVSIVRTPVPNDKAGVNLLLLNDGQDLQAFGIFNIMDSLWKANRLEPLIVVGIQAEDRTREYGVSDQPDFQHRGDKAGKYAQFVNDELYSFIKKKTGIRSFKDIAIAGCSQGGLSAFDIAWDHADRIDKVGIFSGSFWWRNKDITDSTYNDDENRIMLAKVRSSRKRPKLKYWFYAGDEEEKADRDKDGVIDVVDDTRDLIAALEQKKFISNNDIVLVESPSGTHDYSSWKKNLPAFLIWAFGKK